MKQGNNLDKWLLGPEKQSRQAHLLSRLYALQDIFLFRQYEPNRATPRDVATSFDRRLDNWINCFDEEYKWAAFHSLRYFIFAGQDETNEMYRSAVRGRLLPWIVDQAELDIFSETIDADIEKELESAWICPLTDSFRINGFLHVTGIATRVTRPDWLTQKRFADRDSIIEYTERCKLKYLILFEDFVGSGSQCSSIIEFALDSFPGKVFFCPLVVCSPGDAILGELSKKFNNKFFYLPLIVISRDCLVQETPHSDEPKSFAILREAIENGYKKIDKTLDGGAYGFGGVGCLYASYSNCPNNTPPIYHESGGGWMHPLFKRQRRA